MNLQKILALCLIYCMMLCTSLSASVQNAVKFLVRTPHTIVKASQNKRCIILGPSAIEEIQIVGQDYRFHQDTNFSSVSPNYSKSPLPDIFGTAIRNKYIHYVNASRCGSLAFDKQQGFFNLFIASDEIHLSKNTSRFDERPSEVGLNLDVERMVLPALAHQEIAISYATDFVKILQIGGGSHAASAEVSLQYASYKSDSKINYLKILSEMRSIPFEVCSFERPNEIYASVRISEV